MALAATAIQSDQQAKAGGGAGLFELQSLFSGPSTSDQYGAFKPGGSFAPPSLAQFTAAAKGRDTGTTVASAFFPGLGQAIGGLISGPGRGNTRRASARSLVQSTPGLATLQARILRGGTSGFGHEEVSAIRAVIGEARALGGLGSAFGERANMLQDVVKFVFTGETSRPKARVPTLGELEQVFGVNTSTRQALPVGPPTTVAAGSGARSSYWSGMGSAYQGAR